ncbi:sensor histidine kinase [Terrisporobacter mayombei]|uniref:histidine kinase n=1 Tax=Terrisporobacter mayombei TaxID=1541 RepID=A0ABY9Q2I0_9FIRM|nr:HAMP domain-containing sensor histidine kinase [Terrisporobacter mayombei]MCC3867204.1 HAMP domain-containing histidine kinase [Terrisporobacter mayombei]WMT81465.1 Adaptive-response sensory-kinase SasA [Terrisporobacter mayombei]
MDLKNKSISLRNTIIISFLTIIALTILSITIFVTKAFESEFGKYVDDSNKSEVNHLINFDLNNIYKDKTWDTHLIKKLAEDSIEKGIVLGVYDKNNKLIYGILEDEKNESNEILNNIKKNMESIEENWIPKLEEYRVAIHSEKNNKVGYAQISYYESLYYMENDIMFLNIINGFMKVISLISIGSALIIALIISNSISSSIENVSSKAKNMSDGKYNDKLEYNSKIKEVKELVQSINKLSYKLNEQELLRKRITTDVAHELRTPLTSIQGHLDCMIDGIWEATPDRLNSIREEALRLSNLIGQLRILSKYDSENDVLNKSKVNLKEFIQHFIYNYEGDALSKNIKITYDLKEIYINIDKEQFSQVLANLLSNAIKYTNVHGKIHIKAYEDDDNIVISIKDNGIGIPQNDINFIFERFYRVDKSRDKETGGIGIGLSIVKSIVDAHNGHIYVKSKINKGTELIIILPK